MRFTVSTLAFAALSSISFGQISLSFTPDTVLVTGPQQVIVTVNMTVAPGSEFGAGSYTLNATGSGIGLLAITAVDRSGTPFEAGDFQSTVAQVINTGDTIGPVGPDNLLNPSNDRDLGVLAPVNPGFLAPGTYSLATYTLTATGAASGTYTVGFTNVGFFDGAFNSVSVTSTPLTVLVPEPATLALLGLGGLVALRRRK